MIILTARASAAAVALACAAAVLHAVTTGRDPIAILSTATALLGIGLVLTAVLGERGTVRQSGGMVAVVIVAAAAWGLSLAARPPDVLAVLTRVIGFSILGEAYLWRLLNVARGQQRWRDVRNDTLLAVACVAMASLVPGPIDRDVLPALGLTTALVGAIGLSLARSSEELALASGQIRGKATPSAATGTAFALGVLAVGLGFALPVVQAWVTRVVSAVAPILADAIFTILLPLGYVAAYLVALALWIRDLLHPGPFVFTPPPSPFGPGDELARLREMEEARPYVFGAVEVIIALIALAFALALIARLVQERRARTPPGVTVERSAAEGIGLRATLAQLFPRRARRPRRPAEDGTPATALRLIYWSLLDLAESAGPGRRGPAETPAEHEQRLLRTGERWLGASGIVRAFEDLRYGEIPPDAATVDRARAALGRVRTEVAR